MNWRNFKSKERYIPGENLNFLDTEFLIGPFSGRWGSMDCEIYRNYGKLDNIQTKYQLVRVLGIMMFTWPKKFGEEKRNAKDREPIFVFRYF